MTISPRIPEVSCTGKDPLTREQARAIVRRRAKGRQGAMSAYRCEFCHKWHVGSTVPKLPRRFKR